MTMMTTMTDSKAAEAQAQAQAQGGEEVVRAELLHYVAKTGEFYIAGSEAGGTRWIAVTRRELEGGPAEAQGRYAIAVDPDTGLVTGSRSIAEAQAQGGGEAEPTACKDIPDWAIARSYRKHVDALDPQFRIPSALIFTSDVTVEAARMARAAPPSAPVGEEASGLAALVDALDRADRKGYLPDAMQEAWDNFDITALTQQPAAVDGEDAVTRMCEAYYGVQFSYTKGARDRMRRLLDAALAQQPAAIPRLANCGKYTATDNTGQHYYLNHANTWQTFQGQQPASVDGLAGLNAIAGYFQDGSEQTLSVTPDDATRTWHVYVGRQHLGYGATITAALIVALAAQPEGANHDDQ